MSGFYLQNIEHWCSNNWVNSHRVPICTWGLLGEYRNTPYSVVSVLCSVKNAELDVQCMDLTWAHISRGFYLTIKTLSCIIYVCQSVGCYCYGANLIHRTQINIDAISWKEQVSLAHHRHISLGRNVYTFAQETNLCKTIYTVPITFTEIS